MRISRGHIQVSKWFVYTAIIVVVFSAGLYLTHTEDEETPNPEKNSYTQTVLECEQSSSQATCLKDLIISALQNGEYQALALDLSKSPSMNTTCTKVIHEIRGEDLLEVMNLDELVANIDIPVCNGALGERVMPTYAETLDEQGWRALVSSCLKRVSFSVPGKTTPCAKGLGWAVASAEQTLGREFERCRVLIDQAVTDAGLNWESNDLTRYTYGCAHGVMTVSYTHLTLPTKRIV